MPRGTRFAPSKPRIRAGTARLTGRDAGRKPRFGGAFCAATGQRAPTGGSVVLAELSKLLVGDSELRFLGLVEAAAQPRFALRHDPVEADVGVGA